MLVRDIMTTDFITLQEDESLLDATLIFARSGFRHIPILNGTQLAGIVTERDLKHYTPSILSGIPPEEYNRVMEGTPLAKIMIRELVTIEPGESVYGAARLLFDRRIGCLPVVEGGELKGIVTTTDMLKLLIQMLGENDAGPADKSS